MMHVFPAVSPVLWILCTGWDMAYHSVISSACSNSPRSPGRRRSPGPVLHQARPARSATPVPEVLPCTAIRGPASSSARLLHRHHHHTATASPPSTTLPFSPNSNLPPSLHHRPSCTLNVLPPLLLPPLPPRSSISSRFSPSHLPVLAPATVPRSANSLPPRRAPTPAPCRLSPPIWLPPLPPATVPATMRRPLILSLRTSPVPSLALASSSCIWCVLPPSRTKPAVPGPPRTAAKPVK